MSGRNNVSAIVLLVLGGLWIFLAGACSEAVFKGMPSSDKAQLELLLTLPGCVLALAGLNLLIPRQAAGAVVLAYAALLALVWNGALLQHPPHGDALLTMLLLFNTPSALLAVWGLVLLLKRGHTPPS